MRFHLVLAVALTAALIKTGTEGAELLQGRPVLRTCAQLQGDVPDATWLHLQQCKPDPLAGVVALARFGGDRVRVAWVPLRASGAPGSPMVAVLKTQDPGLMALLDRLRALPAGAPSEDVDRIIRNNLGTIQRWGKTLELVAHADPLDADTREVRQLLGEQLLEHAPVLTPGSPNWSVLWTWMFASGLLLAIVAWQFWGARGSELPSELRPRDEPQLGELEAIRREEAEEKAKQK